MCTCVRGGEQWEQEGCALILRSRVDEGRYPAGGNVSSPAMVLFHGSSRALGVLFTDPAYCLRSLIPETFPKGGLGVHTGSRLGGRHRSGEVVAGQKCKCMASGLVGAPSSYLLDLSPVCISISIAFGVLFAFGKDYKSVLSPESCDSLRSYQAPGLYKGAGL